MELAGIVDMQGGLSPELLKYVFVSQETSEQQPGKATFSVFSNQSHSFAVPATPTAGSPAEDSAKETLNHKASAVPATPIKKTRLPPVQAAQVAPEDTAQDISAVKQTAITDFFSPRASTPSVDVPVSGGVQSGDVEGGNIHAFITPCPAVRLAEVPAVFEVQADYDVNHCFDPTHPLFENYSSLAEIARKKAIDELKRSRTYSQPSFAATWHDRTTLGSQTWDPFRAAPTSGDEEVAFDSFSSPPEFSDTHYISAYPVEDIQPDNAKTDAETEKYWIDKDEERLAVIAEQEGKMAEMKEELANTVKAFRMASNANHKLQVELEKKKKFLRQAGKETSDLVHDLDAAEMTNEQLEEDLQHQFDRAEEALTYINADPSKKTIGALVRAKADADSEFLAQRRELESQIDYYESQLKGRCESVAHLTTKLSRVADAEHWNDVRKDVEECTFRAGKLPEELQAALLECDKQKRRYETIKQKYEDQKFSHQEAIRRLEDSNMKAIRKVQNVLEKKATSEEALQECLKMVFERMIRCSLCLELNGYAPLDTKHQEICEKVFEVTGRNYQQPLMKYYQEHSVDAEFDLSGVVDEYVDEDEGSDIFNDEGQAGSEEQVNIEENDEDLVVSAGTTQGSSSTPTPRTKEDDSVITTTTTTDEEIDQELTKTQEARTPLSVGGLIPTLAATPKPESSASPAFSSLIFGSTNASTPTGDNGPSVGKPFDFGFSKDAPPSLFAMFTRTSEAKPDEEAAVLKPSAAPHPAEAKPPASQNPEAKQGSNASAAPVEADPSTSNVATSAPQLQRFNFGGNDSPFTFTASSSSFPGRVPQPGSTGMFAFGEQSSPPVTFQAKEKAVEAKEAKYEVAQEDLSKIEASEEKTREEEMTQEEPLDIDTSGDDSPKQKKEQKEKTFQDEGAPQSPTPTESLSASPSPLSRNQKRAAKKAQEKAAKKAEKEAKDAKMQESRRVQQAMMMR